MARTHVGTTSGDGVCSEGRSKRFFPPMRMISSSPTSFGSFLGCEKWVVMSLRLRLWRVLPCFAALKPHA